MRTWATLLALAAALFTYSGCSSQPTANTAEVTAASTEQTRAVDDARPWQEILPGGESICSDGSPYKFLTRQGDSKKLLVYLQGGGACWFRGNCDPAMKPTYNINLAQLRGYQTGIFNLDNPSNPFKNHTVVFAPYCSGDVHIGASDTEYPGLEPDQPPLTIYHRGRANMQTVLDWTYANATESEEIFVTGSSAGAIPSPFYASLIADHYADAIVTQLGDGAGGYRQTNSDARPHAAWGTFRFITEEAGFDALDSSTMNYESLYIAAAQRHPNIQFAEYDAAQDSVQKSFLALSGQQDVDLLDALTANHADIRAQADNFRSFIAGGESHTVLARPEFYTFAADGTSIRDWVAALANNEEVEDVRCINCDQDGHIDSQ